MWTLWGILLTNPLALYINLILRHVQMNRPLRDVWWHFTPLASPIHRPLGHFQSPVELLLSRCVSATKDLQCFRWNLPRWLATIALSPSNRAKNADWGISHWNTLIKQSEGRVNSEMSSAGGGAKDLSFKSHRPHLHFWLLLEFLSFSIFKHFKPNF